jgi:hypothetical protein
MTAPSQNSVAEEFRNVSAWVRAAIILMLGAYLAAGAALPWKLVAVALGVAGVVVGVVTTVKVFRAPVPGFMRATIPLATLACLLFTLSTGVQSVFYGPTSDYEQCVQDSVTDRAQSQCQRDYEEKLRNLEGIIGR